MSSTGIKILLQRSCGISSDVSDISVFSAEDCNEEQPVVARSDSTINIILPELFACTLIVILQLLRKNIYLSIIAGTACYMILICVV